MDAGGIASAQVVELAVVGRLQGLLRLEPFQVFGYPVEVLLDKSDGFSLAVGHGGCQTQFPLPGDGQPYALLGLAHQADGV